MPGRKRPLGQEGGGREVFRDECGLFLAVDDSATLQIIRRNFNRYPVAGKDANEVFAHFSGYDRQDFLFDRAHFCLDEEHGVR